MRFDVGGIRTARNPAHNSKRPTQREPHSKISEAQLKMDDKTVDKAEAIARLVDLHAEGKISDEELETLRAEAAKPVKKKLKALPFAAVGVLVVAALVLAVIFRGGGSSTEDSLTEPEPAVTAEEPAATTGEPAAGAETTATLAEVPSELEVEERRLNLIKGASISVRNRVQSIAGFRLGPVGGWRLTEQKIATCAQEQWAEYSGYEQKIRDKISVAERTDPFLEKTTMADFAKILDLERFVPNFNSDRDVINQMMDDCSS